MPRPVVDVGTGMDLELDLLRSDLERDGFVVIPGFFGGDLLAEAQGASRLLIEPAAAGGTVGDGVDVIDLREGGELLRVADPDHRSDALGRVVTDPGLLAVLDHLLGEPVLFGRCSLDVVPVGCGGRLDTEHAWAGGPTPAEAPVAVVDVMVQDCHFLDGPPTVVPRSHVDGRAGGDVVALTAPAGSVAVHDVRIRRGTAVNRGHHPRPLLVSSYLRAPR